MVEIALVLDEDGAIERMDFSGHATPKIPRIKGFWRRHQGLNEEAMAHRSACAAVTLMARTVARMAASGTGWTVDGNTPSPGNLSLEILRRPEDAIEWWRGVSETLLQALADVESEYPGSISVSIEEKYHGS